MRVEWSGTAVVGGGVSTFYSSNSAPGTILAAIRAWFLSFNGALPTGVSIVFPSSGETIDDTTGTINGVWTATAPDVVVGQDADPYAAGVGMRVVWNTAGITRGRLVRGATYIVPLSADFYDTNGSIDGTLVSNMQTATDTLIAADSGSLRVWSRPSTSGGSDGASHAITSATVVDAVSWLRTRRT